MDRPRAWSIAAGSPGANDWRRRSSKYWLGCGRRPRAARRRTCRCRGTTRWKPRPWPAWCGRASDDPRVGVANRTQRRHRRRRMAGQSAIWGGNRRWCGWPSGRSLTAGAVGEGPAEAEADNAGAGDCGAVAGRGRPGQRRLDRDQRNLKDKGLPPGDRPPGGSRKEAREIMGAIRRGRSSWTNCRATRPPKSGFGWFWKPWPAPAG